MGTTSWPISIPIVLVVTLPASGCDVYAASVTLSLNEPLIDAPSTFMASTRVPVCANTSIGSGGFPTWSR